LGPSFGLRRKRIFQKKKKSRKKLDEIVPEKKRKTININWSYQTTLSTKETQLGKRNWGYIREET